jgi:hypothetical protein
MLLNEQQVATLRRSASTAHQRRTFTNPIMRVRYSGGPLDGVESIVEQSTASNQFLGWCTVHDRLGPITAMYERTGDPTIWNFRSIDLGVQ